MNTPAQAELGRGTLKVCERGVGRATRPTEKDEQKALALEFCAIATLSVRLAEKEPVQGG